VPLGACTSVQAGSRERQHRGTTLPQAAGVHLHWRPYANRGYLHICQYLYAEQCPWGTEACENAAHEGHLSTLRWLHEQGCPWELRDVRSSAAFQGHVHVMEYLLSARVAPPARARRLTRMLNAAGFNNQLAAAQWLRQRGAEWPLELLYHGNPWQGDTLEWARQQGCTSPVDQYYYSDAN
jgi:hypothetical protein